MVDESGLAVETAYFDKNVRAFKAKYSGRFLLVKGEKVCGNYGTEEAAIDAGIRKFDAGPFLVMRPGDKTTEFTAPALAFGLLQCR